MIQEDNDADLQYHLERIRTLEAELKEQQEYTKLIVDVFLRRTGAIRIDNNWYKVQREDLEEFFMRYNSTKKLTQYDKL
jgi:hypothetical protein